MSTLPIAGIGPDFLNFGGSGRYPGYTPTVDTSWQVPGTVSNSPIPGMPQSGGIGAPGGLGMTPFQAGGLALGGLQTLGNLWGAFQANKLAKRQFQFQKDFSMANLANEISSYNTALEDRIRSRAVTENRDAGYADSYLSERKLPEAKI